MAKKKEKPTQNGKYPLMKVYGDFFMWEENRISEAIKKATELEAPEDTVFLSGKKPITRSNNFWSPTLLELLNKALPV